MFPRIQDTEARLAAQHIGRFGGRGVLVVRNPYKALLSYWNLKRTGSHTRTITDPASLRSEGFRQFARAGAAKWLQLVRDWVQGATELHCIYYEVSTNHNITVTMMTTTQELTSEPTAEMRRLLHHLHLPEDEARLACIQLHSAGSFHRVVHQDQTGQMVWIFFTQTIFFKDPWPPELHQLIDSAIEEANSMLVEATGRPLPLDKYDYYDSTNKSWYIT